MTEHEMTPAARELSLRVMATREAFERAEEDHRVVHAATAAYTASCQVYQAAHAAQKQAELAVLAESMGMTVEEARAL